MDPRLLDRYFVLIAGLLLAMMAGVQVGSAVQESPTNDEPVHLTAGYVYLTTGEYSMDRSHPPLGRILAALPLLGLPLTHIAPENAWLEFKNLVWGNPIPADTIVLRGRLVIVGLTMVFGIWLGWWTRRRFGSSVALLAMTFFVLDPTLIAHGHYVTTDLIASFGIFLTCTFWADFLDRPGWKLLAAAALALGFAITSKYSALFLLAVLPILYVIAWRRNREEPFFTWLGAIKTGLMMGAGASLVVVLCYAQDFRNFGAGRPLPLVQPIAQAMEDGQVFGAMEPATGLLAFGYFRGVHELALHDAAGIPAYLLGHFRRHGWWAYFPVAFLVKTPTGVLAACVIAGLSLWQGRRRLPPAVVFSCLWLPPLAYFMVALRSSFNIGVRHILPIYAFLYVLLALVLIEYGPLLLRRAWRWTVVGLIVLVGAESISVYPHYLAFFNMASGGPGNGPRYLLDSNIDWGQDVKGLSVFVREHNLTPLCTALFTGAPMGYYGIAGRDLNQTGTPEGVANLPCAVAVSVNLLQGLFNSPKKYAALRRREPIARIGYSIYVYDLRR